MAKGLGEYDIKFTGLKLGHHTFEFELNQKLFDAFEISEIDGGQINVNIDLEKQSTMLVVKFHLVGSADSICDRCTDPLKFDVDYFLVSS